MPQLTQKSGKKFKGKRAGFLPALNKAMQPWIIIVIAIGAVICTGFALATLLDASVFGKRCNKNPLLKYFTAKDFGLTAEDVTVNCGKTALCGHIYRNESASAQNFACQNLAGQNMAGQINQNSANQNLKQKLIIFAHGMGPGQAAYTTEIAYFCSLGYTVLALDSKGCNLSKGKNIGGMYQGAKTVIAAIDYAARDKNLKTLPVALVGHSWGGYSVLCASAKRKVEKVVAISAPKSPVKTIINAAPKAAKPLVVALSPFWFVINIFKFGFSGNANAANCAKKSGAKTLIIHGENDAVVPPQKGAYGACKGKNVTKILVKEKLHNPYNTASAEAELARLTQKLAALKALSEEEKTEFFSNFNYKAATEEDEEVMRTIAEFIN